MMTKIWIITAFVVLSLAGMSMADDESSIAQIQTQVEALLEENAKLEAEYKLLNENARSLERAIDEQSQKAKRAEEQARQNVGVKEVQEKSAAELQQKIDELQKNITAQRQIKARLQNESSQLDQDYKALQKQIASIPQEKEDLAKEIKFKQFAFNQAQEGEALELRDLTNELKRLENAEQKLLASLKNVKKVPSSKEEIKRIKKENKALQRQIQGLKKEIKVKTKANAPLKQKTLSSSKLAADEIWQKEKERLALSQYVEQLQSQVDALEQNINAYLAEQTRREELLQEIMQLNEENEALRQRISPTP